MVWSCFRAAVEVAMVAPLAKRARTARPHCWQIDYGAMTLWVTAGVMATPACLSTLPSVHTLTTPACLQPCLLCTPLLLRLAFNPATLLCTPFLLRLQKKLPNEFADTLDAPLGMQLARFAGLRAKARSRWVCCW